MRAAPFLCRRHQLRCGGGSPPFAWVDKMAARAGWESVVCSHRHCIGAQRCRGTACPGLGVRYQLSLSRAKTFRRFLAAPVQLPHSNIPDRATLQSTSLLLRGVTDPGPSRPVEDHIGGE